MRRAVLLSATLLAFAGSLGAQARSDQSRLSFGVGLGYNGGTDLWSIHDQKIRAGLGIDSADVSRIIRPTIGVTFLGVYYPDAHWGLSGEVHLIGLAYEDHCRLTTNSGTADNKLICDNINGKQSPGTAVSATVGGSYRPFAWTGVQPYLRGNLGLTLSEQSALRTRATYVPSGDSVYHDYLLLEDSRPTTISPTWALATGITGFIGRSTQLRVEVKDNFVILKEARGTVEFEAREPPWQQTVHQVVTLSVALEVVLEKRRGRRY